MTEDRQIENNNESNQASEEPRERVDTPAKKKAAVVKEYPFHILMDWGKYRSSVNKVDVYTGDVKLARI